MTPTQRETFQKTVLDYYSAHGRHDMPWRIQQPDGSFDPYHILVSEFMLQQTQVSRVIPKYLEFLHTFPSVQILASASLGEVLTAWSGLGYNRRAKFLWQAARMIVDDRGGVFPHTTSELTKLPGVGRNTAGAILAYAFNLPVVFVETNIRTAYIHHFFHDETDITDTAILELVKATLPEREEQQRSAGGGFGFIEPRVSQYRIWYWALMDYGAYLKQIVGNLNKLSKSYIKQSPFQGSLRQIRGQVIRQLAIRPMDVAELEAAITDERLGIVLKDLLAEGMIRTQGSEYMLT